MTDNEIIKALELCFAEKGTKQTCGKCPYHKFGELCKVKRGRDTLDLLKSVDTDKIKADAIKEFAKRLKALDRLDVDVSYGYGREHYTEAIAVNLIDNLVKEMVGEE